MYLMNYTALYLCLVNCCRNCFRCQYFSNSCIPFAISFFNLLFSFLAILKPPILLFSILTDLGGLHIPLRVTIHYVGGDKKIAGVMTPQYHKILYLFCLPLLTGADYPVKFNLQRAIHQVLQH